VLEPVGEHLWVAGSHIDLAAAEVELAGVVGRELILRDKLAELDERFDFLFIDCPPSLGILTINALTAVDEVFLPLQPHF
jgi:chromosome partitioning protein